MQTFGAEPRPDVIHRPPITSSFSKEELVRWLEAGEFAATWPSREDSIHVASISSFERISYRRQSGEHRLLLPRDKPIVADSLLEALLKLPRIEIIEKLVPFYDGIAEGGVTSVREDIAGSIPDNLLMLCPRLAVHVGLYRHPTDPFAYINSDGNVVVRTIWWRDGGVARHGGDRSVRGQGYVLVATKAAFETIRPYLGSQRCAHVWRSTTGDHGPSEQDSRRFVTVFDVGPACA